MIFVKLTGGVVFECSKVTMICRNAYIRNSSSTTHTTRTQNWPPHNFFLVHNLLPDLSPCHWAQLAPKTVENKLGLDPMSPTGGREGPQDVTSAVSAIIILVALILSTLAQKIISYA
jgi:hypothetical protein